MDNDNQPLLGELDKARLAALIEATKLFNGTLDRDEVLRRLMALAARGANADRATLYLIDESRRELRSIVALGDDDRLREIRLPLGEGLAGYVARTGETVNVADAYADPRFSRRIDDETGYRTRTVLAVPLRDPQGRIGGVGWGLSDSIWPTLLQENVEEDKRGRAFSLFLGAVTIPPAITVYLGGWLADHTSLRLVYGLAGVWVLLAAIGSRFLPGYRAIPARSEEGMAAVDTAPCPVVDS